MSYALVDKIISNIHLKYVGEKKRSEEMVYNSSENLVVSDQRMPVRHNLQVNTSILFENILSSGVDFQLSIHNLFDTAVVHPENTGAILNDLPMPGRMVTGNMSYNF